MKKFIRKLVFIFPLLKIFINKLGRNKFKVKKNNKVDIKQGFVRGSSVEIKGKNNYFRIGKDTKIYNCNIDINGNNNSIDIRDNVTIPKGDIKLWGNNNKLEIGESTTFNTGCKIKVFEGTKIIIGKHCMISYDVDMRSSDGHPIFDENGKRINDAKDIFVGDHVWLGSYVNLLKGATVPVHSVVGTGSLVTKKHEQTYSIIFGRPAEVKRININWQRKF